MNDPAPKIKWKTNEVIRHLETGHPYLVLHTSNFYTSIVDLMATDPLVQMLTLLPRHYDEYALDSDIRLKKNEKKELEGMRMVFQFKRAFI
jgi:hypothetical protein